MGKRFTATEKWDDPWYRRLSPKLKTLWQYLCDKCDNAGVWKVDYEMASFCIGEPVDKSDFDALNNGKERIVLKNDNFLVLKDFIPFQIGNLKKTKKSNLQKNCKALIDMYLNKGIDLKVLTNLTGKVRVSYPKLTGIGKGIGIGTGISNSFYKEGVVKGKNKTSQDFFSSIKNNSAYKNIDIDRELAKMDAWLLTRPGRQKTKRFIINWLNKVDVPIATKPPKPKSAKPVETIPESERFQGSGKKFNELIKSTTEKIKSE